MRITTSADMSNLQDLAEIKRYSSQILSEVKDALNGNISTDNLRSVVVQLGITAANTDYKISHRMGKIPVGYWKISGPNVALFDGSVEPTENEIYIRSSGVGTVTVLVLG